MRVLVTGCSGLIGSEAVTFFDRMGFPITGIDNNMRADFFGAKGDTTWNLSRLKSSTKNFHHTSADIRDRAGISRIVADAAPNLIVHAAAQPSHDLAASRPYDDFDVNAVGTLNLLEAARQARDAHRCDPVFVFMSTNKVYGDTPNELSLKELPTRWDYALASDFNGVREDMRIDRCLHSVFGASKVAADVMCQEYGKYFELKTGTFRGGCLTGPNHSGVELHGFLSFLIKCNLEGRKYSVYGYKGKQVRDNIHSRDVAGFIHAFIDAPRVGEVYNLGGGRDNSCSILEAFQLAENVSGKKMVYDYVDKNREGDHICYISDLSKIKAHYPNWSLTKSLADIFTEIHQAWVDRVK
jgi:CDP-paratose 2-epimerase